MDKNHGLTQPTIGFNSEFMTSPGFTPGQNTFKSTFLN